MSNISALPAPGLDAVGPAKPAESAASNAPSAPPQSAASPTTPDVPTPHYPSPRFTVDPLSDTVLVQYRSANTGDITSQIPPRQVVRIYDLTGHLSGAGGGSTVSGAA